MSQKQKKQPKASAQPKQVRKLRNALNNLEQEEAKTRAIVIKASKRQSRPATLPRAPPRTDRAQLWSPPLSRACVDYINAETMNHWACFWDPSLGSNNAPINCNAMGGNVYPVHVHMTATLTTDANGKLAVAFPFNPACIYSTAKDGAIAAGNVNFDMTGAAAGTTRNGMPQASQYAGVFRGYSIVSAKAVFAPMDAYNSQKGVYYAVSTRPFDNNSDSSALSTFTTAEATFASLGNAKSVTAFSPLGTDGGNKFAVMWYPLDDSAYNAAYFGATDIQGQGLRDGPSAVVPQVLISGAAASQTFFVDISVNFVFTGLRSVGAPLGTAKAPVHAPLYWGHFLTDVGCSLSGYTNSKAPVNRFVPGGANADVKEAVPDNAPSFTRPPSLGPNKPKPVRKPVQPDKLTGDSLAFMQEPETYNSNLQAEMLRKQYAGARRQYGSSTEVIVEPSDPFPADQIPHPRQGA